jgi:hypothetical protein
MIDVLNCSRAPGNARWVLAAIAERFNAKTARCHPSIGDIADRTGLCRRTVLRSIATLEQCGELHVERRTGRPNRYRVTLGDPRHPLPNRGQNGTGASESPVSQRHPTSDSEALHQCLSGTRTGKEPGKNQVETSSAPAKASADRLGKKGTAKKGTTEKPPPDPRVSALIAAFAEQHQQTLGTKYMVSGARDGKAFKRALATYDEASIRRALAPYFADRRSLDHIGADVPKFVGRIATLLATSASNGAVAPAYRDFTGHGQAAVRQRQEAAAREGTACK